jgi:hypothetical protein
MSGWLIGGEQIPTPRTKTYVPQHPYPSINRPQGSSTKSCTKNRIKPRLAEVSLVSFALIQAESTHGGHAKALLIAHFPEPMERRARLRSWQRQQELPSAFK